MSYQVRLGSPLPSKQSAFQPKGVRRDRTENFMELRVRSIQKHSLHDNRLARRLEKLVALHYPPPEISSSSSEGKDAENSTLGLISDFGESFRGKSVKDLWNSTVNSKGIEERAEQAIVKWQEDSEAIRCPICSAQFGLKTRRHHCRLCGRVVCYLPPTAPAFLPLSPIPDSPPPVPGSTRKERCSTFITYEYETSPSNSGEKILRGSVIEIETVEVGLSIKAVVNDTGANKPKDERKKVRVCRDCLQVVLRQQMQNQPVSTPPWLKLYEMLVQLEKEIEATLPEFQELVLGLQKSSISTSTPPSTLHAQNLRKSLLSNLANYDIISKKIKKLPLIESSVLGGSQDRLQQAIAARGTLFLTNKLTLLRTLGNLEGEKEIIKQTKNVSRAKEIATRTLANLLGEEEKVVTNEKEQKLSILEEQFNLVQGYILQANSRRLFEDAASLSQSLLELEEEISRIKST